MQIERSFDIKQIKGAILKDYFGQSNKHLWQITSMKVKVDGAYEECRQIKPMSNDDQMEIMVKVRARQSERREESKEEI